MEEVPQLALFFSLLNPQSDITEIMRRVTMMRTENYHCFGAYVDGELAAITGVWMLEKHYVGTHIEPDHVVVLPAYRGQGIGGRLMDFIEAWAKDQKCTASELNCYVNNASGVEFWIRRGYKILGFHMQKKI